MDSDTPVRRRFLARLEKECGNRGVIYLLHNGLKHEKYTIDLFYGTRPPVTAKQTFNTQPTVSVSPANSATTATKPAGR